MKRWFIIATIILVPFNFVHSQTNGFEKIIKAQLKSVDKKSIEKAEKFYNESAAEMKLADETESVNKKKAFKIKIKSSKSLGKANKIVYRVYKQDLKQFFNNIDPVKAKKAELKIDKAGLLMKEAKKKREASLRINVFENAYLVASKADNYEKEAIQQLIEVYGVFIGSSSAVGNEKVLSEMVDETDKEEKIESVTLETDKEADEIITEEVEEKTSYSYVPIRIKGTNGVFFLIQVTASRTPIAQAKLRQSYKEDIHGELLKDWYRYVINERFATLEDAEKYKANAGIRGTLIIAIKNGQKVSIQEAQKKDEVKLSEMEYSPVGGRETVTEEKTKTVVTSKIVYRLEIGISTSKLSAAEVRKFKSGGKSVVSVDRGGWYSYTIGDFSTAAQAQNFKRQRGLSDAVVLKLKDGKVID